MALMLLPYWTDQCIGSMEGLFFESSASTPFHFLNSAELAKAPSNPMRDLPYETLDVDEGVEQLRIMGARYYLAFSPEAVAQAQANPGLELVATSGQWQVYEVIGSELVAPLANEPAVVTGLGGKGREWLDVSVDWYVDNAAHDVFLAADGPKDWPRVEATAETPESEHHGAAVTVETPPKVPLPPVAGTKIRSGDDNISFDVNRIGTPVLVKASYFPNWKASGAEGPYRVTPNLMVVVPTERHVTLHYGWTPVDVAGVLLTLVGIALTVVLAVRKPVDFGDGAPRRSDDEPEQLTLELPPTPSRAPVPALDRGG